MPDKKQGKGSSSGRKEAFGKGSGSERKDAFGKQSGSRKDSEFGKQSVSRKRSSSEKKANPWKENSSGRKEAFGKGSGSERKDAFGKQSGSRKDSEFGKRDISRDRSFPEDRSPRKKTICPVSDKCGGCSWINKSYEEQLEAKATRFRKLMEPFCRVERIIAMEEPAHYRNKVHAVFGEDRRHNAISGIYEEKSHRIVPVDSCLIENRKADEIIVSIRGLLKSFKIRPYDEDTGRGLLRHVLVRVGHATGQIMVVLVLGYPVLPSKNNFVKALLKLHPEITTIVINVNDQDTSMVLGDKEQTAYGKGYIEDELCGMTFRISPKSFYQVNPVQAEKLYERAINYACLTGQETVVDAYCGTGTIGMIASRQAGKVLGVELNRDAVRDAISNAKRNGVSNIRFFRGDAGEFLLEMAEEEMALDVLLLDPPRIGSSEAFLDAAARIRPKRIVYISCNPETLVRDLRVLVKKGYRVEKGVAVDMFPYTDELEAVVSLGL